MKVFALTHLLVSAVSAWDAFTTPDLTTHEPNGNPEGQVNYYHMGMTVNSTDNPDEPSAYCRRTWGDNGVNGFTEEVPYSKYVPLDWYQCDSVKGAYDQGSKSFEFRLHPYFSIGNFTMDIRQNFTKSFDNGTSVPVSLTGTRHVSNETDAADFTCQVNPQNIYRIVHASGDCSIPAGAPPMSIGISEVIC